MDADLRPDRPGDFKTCLAIFDSNVPPYFDPSERPDFVDFLQGLPHGETHFLVVLRNGLVVGCGGLKIDPVGRQATLCWGMVHRACHGAGLGTRLTRARLALAATLPHVRTVALSTSQHTQGFYATFGFSLHKRTPDGFGPGLECCDMVMPIT